MDFIFLNEAVKEAEENIINYKIMNEEGVYIEDCMKSGTYEGLLEYQILCEKELFKLQMEEISLLNEEDWILNEADDPTAQGGAGGAPADPNAQAGGENKPDNSQASGDTSSNQQGDKSDTQKKFSAKIREYIGKVIKFAKNIGSNFGVWLNQFSSFAKKAYTKWKNNVEKGVKIKASNSVVEGTVSKQIADKLNAINTTITELINVTSKPEVTDAEIAKQVQDIDSYKDDGKNSFKVLKDQIASDTNLVDTDSKTVWDKFMEVDTAYQTLNSNLLKLNSATNVKTDKLAQDQNNIDKNAVNEVMKLSKVKQTVSQIISGIYNAYWKVVVSGLKNAVQEAQPAEQQPAPADQNVVAQPNPAAAADANAQVAPAAGAENAAGGTELPPVQ